MVTITAAVTINTAAPQRVRRKSAAAGVAGPVGASDATEPIILLRAHAKPEAALTPHMLALGCHGAVYCLYTWVSLPREQRGLGWPRMGLPVAQQLHRRVLTSGIRHGGPATIRLANPVLARAASMIKLC